MLCPGELDWEPIAEWFEGKGNAAIRKIDLEKDMQYWQWLSTQMGHSLSSVPDMVSGTETSLLYLPASCGRDSGYRDVKPEGLKKKMRDLTVAKALRTWDIAVVCSVPEIESATEASANEASAIVAASANEASAIVAEAEKTHREHIHSIKKNRFVDFHHRACAMHFLAYSFWDRGQELPTWFRQLAGKIPVENRGKLSQLEWRCSGLGQAADQQYGQVRLSWLDILQIIMKEPSWATSGGSSLQDRIFQISPEYASKLSDWKNMKTLVTRVDKKVYNFLETAMAFRACIHFMSMLVVTTLCHVAYSVSGPAHQFTPPRQYGCKVSPPQRPGHYGSMPRLKQG